MKTGGLYVMRRMVLFAILLALVLSIVPVPGIGASKAEAADASSYKIIGYYPAWGAYGRNYQVWDMDASKVTHINYAFADICWNGIHGNSSPSSPNPQTWTCQDENGVMNAPNGTIVMGDPFIDAQKTNPGDNWNDPLRGNFKQLIKLKAANPQLKTIISVGGWSWSNRFSDVAATAATREVFANSAVDFLRKYQFDGVDLDWEYPVSGGLDGNSVRPQDKQNYTLLLNAIRTKLDAAGTQDGKRYLLTIASGASQSFVTNTELSAIAQVVDWINIMTYDFNGGWQTISGHNAPLYNDPAAATAGVPNATVYNVEAGVNGHLNAGVPPSKLVMGTPFYGRGWQGCQSAGNGQYKNCTGPASVGTFEAGSFDYSDLAANYINKNGYTRYWNNVAKVPYLYNPSNGLFISYDDVESFGHKTDFIKSKGLGGAMFWEFSGDRQSVLLAKLKADLQGPAAPPDTIAPSVPSGVNAVNVTSTSITLNWTASTDNVGVKNYTVSYGSGTLVSNGTSATINGLTPNTDYTITVRAADAAGNVSAPSVALIVRTTAPVVDTTPPSVPAGLVASGVDATSITLNWTASTDNVGVTGYTVSYGAGNSVQATGTSATISGLTADTQYTFTVRASDAAGNVSGASAALTVKTSAVPACTATPWTATGVFPGGQRASYNGQLYEAKWWTQGDRPDLSGEWGVWKLIGVCGGSGGGGGTADTSAPSVPAGLQASAVSTTSITLSWNASTDNVGVTGYTVFYGNAQSLAATGTTAVVNGLTSNTAYTFTVAAKDAAGNVSAPSSAVSATTTANSNTGNTAAWAAGITYKPGDVVSYGGKTYTCLQNHTSIVSWEPANAAALWQLRP